MYNTEKIVDAIAGQVGFERSYAIELAPSLLESETGITYNQGHPLVTYANLLASIDETEVGSYPLHSITQPYKRGDVAKDESGQLWQALQDVDTPGALSSLWEKTNHLSVILKRMREAAAAEVLSSLMERKQLAGKSKAIWEKVKLYEGAGPLVKTIPKENRFVGFELDMRNLSDLAVRLHAIGLQVSAPQATLPIYIYNTSVAEPIHIEVLQNVGNGRFSWHRLDKTLAHISERVDAGGSWIIGYKESELVGYAISKEDVKFGQAPCASCSMYNVEAYRKYSKHLSINPFTVSETYIGADNALWDIDENLYNYNTNFGINLSLTLECEITDTVINHARHFANAQKLAVVEKMLQLLAANTRNNADAQMTRQLADYELNNRENHTAGLSVKKEKAMGALDFNTSDLSPLCFPGKDTRLFKNPI